MMRKPIITVLGHVDSGKSTLLDEIRGTDLVAKEPGGITQHIGATEVPITIVKKISGKLIEKYKFDIKITGLLFIDTPGHEAFTNLRKRGGSIADLAIVVVDIMKGLQNQTHEAIDILKSYKTPFIVAANKVDSLPGWHSEENSTATDSMEMQSETARHALDTKIYELVGQLHAKGFTSERFDRCLDFSKEIPIIPVSAKKGEGIAEVLMFLAALSQKYLEKRLAVHVSGAGKGTVLEVKEERGLGKTVDVILYDGMLKVGEQIALGGRHGVIKTKIRALLEPKALDEMRSPQEKFRNVQEVHAAAGVKIAAPNLDDALGGSPLRVVETGKEEREIAEEMEKVRISTDATGAVVKADALGSLEALVKLLESRGIKVRKADMGEVSRRDVMEMGAVREKDPLKAVIFAFNVPVSEGVQTEADKQCIQIISGNVIYKILEEYESWLASEDERRKAEKLAELTLPFRIQILPGCVFRNSKPAIVGVRVLAGRLRAGTGVATADGKRVGDIDAVQSEGKSLSEAREGKEVAVSIRGATIGRNIHEGDELVSLLSEKQSAALRAARCLLSQSEIELLEELGAKRRIESFN